jgi:hypothetical protein
MAGEFTPITFITRATRISNKKISDPRQGKNHSSTRKPGATLTDLNFNVYFAPKIER